MTDVRWDDVDRYASDLLVRPDETLAAALRAADAAGLPPISVSPPQGKFLMLLAQAIVACRILEIGTLAGYSAIWLARALPADGRLVTMDVDANHASGARQNSGCAQLADIVDIHDVRAMQSLDRLVAA